MKNQTNSKWPHQILVVESDRDWTVFLGTDLVVIDGRLVIWDDGSRQRSFEILEILEDDPDVFSSTKKAEQDPMNGVRYTFRPLTLPLYESQVAPKLGISTPCTNLEQAYVLIQNSLFA